MQVTNLEKILGICVIKGYKTPINKTLKKKLRRQKFYRKMDKRYK